MSHRIESVHWSTNNQGNPYIDKFPDTCPICLKGVVPIKIHAYGDEDKNGESNSLQIVFRCPRLECKRYFITSYGNRAHDWTQFFFRDSQPHSRRLREFSKTVQEISPGFCDIYNQAFSAEQSGLLEICGVGYRKSLEFLIKDYLISTKPEEAEKIRSQFLGTCIDKQISSPQIKTVAKRAVWLGNDEAHYMRKWEGKDLVDLKSLIDLTVHWLEMEKLTQTIVEEMPD